MGKGQRGPEFGAGRGVQSAQRGRHGRDVHGIGRVGRRFGLAQFAERFLFFGKKGVAHDCPDGEDAESIRGTMADFKRLSGAVAFSGYEPCVSRRCGCRFLRGMSSGIGRRVPLFPDGVVKGSHADAVSAVFGNFVPREGQRSPRSPGIRPNNVKNGLKGPFYKMGFSCFT